MKKCLSILKKNYVYLKKYNDQIVLNIEIFRECKYMYKLYVLDYMLKVDF